MDKPVFLQNVLGKAMITGKSIWDIKKQLGSAPPNSTNISRKPGLCCRPCYQVCLFDTFGLFRKTTAAQRELSCSGGRKSNGNHPVTWRPIFPGLYARSERSSCRKSQWISSYPGDQAPPCPCVLQNGSSRTFPAHAVSCQLLVRHHL